MWARTFSASCSSSELEWVFFSVTPTSGSASRMALLLTSSSLARSLIRTLLIRPFCFPALWLGLHRSPHGVSFLDSHAIELSCACHDYSVVF
jgi:fumarate reductase subunit D